jgi:nitrate reductase gamma subunit
MNAFLFGVFPYLAVAVALVGFVRRFGAMRHTVVASSSQLLENRLQFWGSVSWHYAILTILAAHLAALLFPAAVGAALSSPGRLLAIELTGFALGLTALWGLLLLGIRRTSLRGETTWLDWTVMAVLLVQVGSGLWVASSARWGLAWFPHVATPWLASLVRLAPKVEFLAKLPVAVKVHVVGAFTLLALFPYTRLAHALAAPVEYLWRLPQLVTWRRPRPAGLGGAR